MLSGHAIHLSILAAYFALLNRLHSPGENTGLQRLSWTNVSILQISGRVPACRCVFDNVLTLCKLESNGQRARFNVVLWSEKRRDVDNGISMSYQCGYERWIDVKRPNISALNQGWFSNVNLVHLIVSRTLGNGKRVEIRFAVFNHLYLCFSFMRFVKTLELCLVWRIINLP